MDPLTLSMIAAGGQAVIQGIQGGRSLYEGLKMDPGERPMYEGSQRLRSASTGANIAAQGRMANVGAMQRDMQSNAASSQASFGRAATDASQAFLGTAAVGEQSSQGLMNLAQLETQDKARREAVARAADNALVQDERMVFQDKQAKYFEDVQTKQQLIAGGFEGLGAALGTGAQIGMLGYQSQNQLGSFDPDPYGYKARNTGANPRLATSTSTPGGMGLSSSGLMESAMEMQGIRIRPQLPTLGSSTMFRNP